MKTLIILFTCMYLLMISATGSAPGAAESWTEWRNALKPKGAPGAPITLAVDGKTDYLIVTPDNATTQERKAALELAHWLEQITGASFPISGIPILENGDFEISGNWGEKSLPYGWEAPTDKYQPPARMQTGIHAVGGSGISAYMPNGGRNAMQQTIYKTGSVWTLELDFASEDPPPEKHVDSSMYVQLRNAQDVVIFVLRVTDLDDDGTGELRFRVGTNDEEPWIVLDDVVVFDDDVEKTPLVHHLRIEGHFDSEDPYCDVFLTDPEGEIHEIRGITKSGDPSGQRVGPAVIRSDTTGNTADHLLDNVRFSIPEKQGRGDKIISVGRTELLKAANLPVATKDLGDEGYAIAQHGEQLFLIGGKNRGPIYAALALLEEDLGCRWYTSSKPVSEARIHRIPKLPTLTFRPVPRSYVPVFSNREPYYTVAWDSTWSLLNRTNATNVGIPEAWGGTFNYALHAHSFGTLMPASYFDEHPEYFMATDEGQRISKQPCLTNPDVLRIVTANLLEILAQRPTAEITMVSYNDGQSHCRCGPCMALNEANNSPQGALLTFVNQVAEEVEKHFPDVLICTGGYVETLAAPTQVRARHNVSVRIGNAPHEWRYPLTSFTTSDAPLSRHYREEVVKWSKVCQTLQVWDYSANFSHFLAPMPNLHTFGPDMRFYAKNNVKGIFMQGIPKVPGGERTPIKAWVLAKLFWDPGLDTHELEQDFIWGSWKPEVVPLMAEYAELLNDQADDRPLDPTTGSGHQGNRYNMKAPFLTRAFIDEAKRIFDEAEAAAQSEKTRKRVERARLPIMYVQLMRGPDFTGDTYGSLIDRFQTLAPREGYSWLGMHSGSSQVDSRIAQWRSQWEEYQQVRDIEKSEYEIVPLSNEWRFAPDPTGQGEAQNWHAPSFDDSTWALQRSDIRRGWEKQGFLEYRGVGWYRQTLVPGDELKRKHVYLYFTSVVEDAWIYLDGEQVLENSRESTGLAWRQILVTPFAVEVGDRLVPGQAHTLAVRVDSNQRLGMYKPAYLLASDRPLEATAMTVLMNREAGQSNATALAIAQENLKELQDRKKQQQAGGGRWRANPYQDWSLEDEWASVEATLKQLKSP